MLDDLREKYEKFVSGREHIVTGVAFSAAVGVLIFGAMYVQRLVTDYYNIPDRLATKEITTDLNGNGLLETYIESNGKKYFSSIDENSIDVVLKNSAALIDSLNAYRLENPLKYPFPEDRYSAATDSLEQ